MLAPSLFLPPPPLPRGPLPEILNSRRPFFGNTFYNMVAFFPDPDLSAIRDLGEKDARKIKQENIDPCQPERFFFRNIVFLFWKRGSPPPPHARIAGDVSEAICQASFPPFSFPRMPALLL